jgi:hypothetical protein
VPADKVIDASEHEANDTLFVAMASIAVHGAPHPLHLCRYREIN